MGQPTKVSSVTPVVGAKLNEIKSKNNIKNDVTVFAYEMNLANGDNVTMIVGDSNGSKQPDAGDVFKIVEGAKLSAFDKKLVNNVEKKVITLDANSLKTELSKAISGTTINTDNNTPSYAFTLSGSNELKSLLVNKAVITTDSLKIANNKIVGKKDGATQISYEATMPEDAADKFFNDHPDQAAKQSYVKDPTTGKWVFKPMKGRIQIDKSTLVKPQTPAKVVTNPVVTPAKVSAEAPATPAAPAASSSNIPDAISFTSEQLDSLKEYGITQAVIDDVNNLPIDKLNKLFTATPGESNVHIDGLSLKMKRNLAILQKAAASKGIVLPTVNSAFRTYDEQEALFKKYGSSRAAEPGSSWHEDKDGKGGNAIDFKDSGNSDNRVLAGIWTKMGNRWGGSFKTGIKEPWHFDLGSPSGSPDSIDRDSFNSFNMVMGNPFMNFFNLMDYSALGYNFGFCAASLAGAGNLYDTSYFNYEDKFFGSILGNLANFTNKLATGTYTFPMNSGFSHIKFNEYKALPVDLSAEVTKYSPIVDKYSKEHGLDPEFVFSMIKQESGFKPDNVSSSGAKGLMQLMPGTADTLNVDNVFDPDDNVKGGTRYIADQIDTFNNDKKLALAAYNAGPNRVKKLMNQYGSSYEKICPQLPQETKDYVNKVMENYGTFDKWGKKSN